MCPAERVDASQRSAATLARVYLPAMRNGHATVTCPGAQPVALAVIAMLAGCGMKGDLYLPPPEARGPPAAGRPASETQPPPPPAAEVQAEPTVESSSY